MFYVTALYNIYNTPEVSTRLLKDILALINADLSLVIFVDDFYRQHLVKLPPKVIVYFLPLSDLIIYNMILANKSYLNLPDTRYLPKDTYEYLALMNTKIEFLKIAKNITGNHDLTWIDAGISKLIKNPTIFWEKLKNLGLSDANRNKVYIPGCYQRNLSFQQLCTSVWWVFSGSFFICGRNAIDKFYTLSLQSLSKFMIHKYIVWEVNVWADMYYQYPNFIIWYYGNHDDSIANLPHS